MNCSDGNLCFDIGTHVEASGVLENSSAVFGDTDAATVLDYVRNQRLLQFSFYDYPNPGLPNP
jgi:hypothetical protein